MAESLIQQQGIMVASLQTENLGIEQIIEFCLGQPNLRFIILCGIDTRQTIGHLPGQSFISLQTNGVDNSNRIIGAEGKRPILKNITQEAITHFRQTVTLIDQVDKSDKTAIMTTVETCLENNPGPAKSLPNTVAIKTSVTTYKATEPPHMIADSAGYCVIELLPEKCAIGLTHYLNNGEINGRVEGQSHKAIYCKALELGWVSQLDHAAYLGRELYRAEQALNNHNIYIQDKLTDLKIEP